MDKNTCGNCVHYLQHYTLNKEKIFRVCCGHCTYLRAKRKRPYAKACENYSKAESNEQAFVSKEYLSKVLLEYVLNLELLPKINNAED